MAIIKALREYAALDVPYDDLNRLVRFVNYIEPAAREKLMRAITDALNQKEIDSLFEVLQEVATVPPEGEYSTGAGWKFVR